jgi:hypothetical protein
VGLERRLKLGLKRSDSYSPRSFVLLQIGADIPQNKPCVRFSTVLKMDTPPFLTVVVQSLNRVSCADTGEAQPQIQLIRVKLLNLATADRSLWF